MIQFLVKIIFNQYFNLLLSSSYSIFIYSSIIIINVIMPILLSLMVVVESKSGIVSGIIMRVSVSWSGIMSVSYYCCCHYCYCYFYHYCYSTLYYTYQFYSFHIIITAPTIMTMTMTPPYHHHVNYRIQSTFLTNYIDNYLLMKKSFIFIFIDYIYYY